MRIAVPALVALAIGTGALFVSGRPKVKSEEASRKASVDLFEDLNRQLRSRVGSLAPDLGFRLLSDDSQHTISEFRGRVVVLNIWATGCGPCRAEMPALAALQARFGSDLAVITLTPEFPSQVRRALEGKSLTLPPLSGYTKRYEWVPRRVIPVTLFVDRAGIIREFAIGKRSEQEFETAFKPYL